MKRRRTIGERKTQNNRICRILSKAQKLQLVSYGDKTFFSGLNLISFFHNRFPRQNRPELLPKKQSGQAEEKTSAFWCRYLRATTLQPFATKWTSQVSENSGESISNGTKPDWERKKEVNGFNWPTEFKQLPITLRSGPLIQVMQAMLLLTSTRDMTGCT